MAWMLLPEDRTAMARRRRRYPVQYEITDRTRHTAIPAQFDDYIARELGKLDPILASFPQDAVLLRVLLDEASRRGDVEVQLRLALPSGVLTSHQDGPPEELRSIFDTALQALRRQLIEHKQRL
jgi:ribosome-associated translation inhibitor RaiA